MKNDAYILPPRGKGTRSLPRAPQIVAVQSHGDSNNIDDLSTVRIDMDDCVSAAPRGDDQSTIPYDDSQSTVVFGTKEERPTTVAALLRPDTPALVPIEFDVNEVDDCASDAEMTPSDRVAPLVFPARGPPPTRFVKARLCTHCRQPVGVLHRCVSDYRAIGLEWAPCSPSRGRHTCSDCVDLLMELTVDCDMSTGRE